MFLSVTRYFLNLPLRDDAAAAAAAAAADDDDDDWQVKTAKGGRTRREM